MTAASPDPPRGRLRRALRLAAWILGAGAAGFALGIVIHNAIIMRGVEREIETTPRDAVTGVIKGTEPVTLGDEGATTAVLMLHGFVGSRIDFADLGGLLAAEGLRVRMALLPGHGTTPRDFAMKTPDDLVAAARAEAADLRKRHGALVVVGFSMGGAIATILASEGLADRLVLISPYYDVTYFPYYVLPPNVWNRMFSPMIPFVRKGEAFIKVNRRESLPMMFSYGHVPTRGARTLAELGKRASRPATLANIACPVLLLHSRGDEAADFEAAERAMDAMGSGEKEFVEIDRRNNHHLLWDYDRGQVKDVVVKSLRR